MKNLRPVVHKIKRNFGDSFFAHRKHKYVWREIYGLIFKACALELPHIYYRLGERFQADRVCTTYTLRVLLVLWYYTSFTKSFLYLLPFLFLVCFAESFFCFDFFSSCCGFSLFLFLLAVVAPLSLKCQKKRLRKKLHKNFSCLMLHVKLHVPCFWKIPS